LLALVMMFSATAVVAGPAAATPSGNNGQHKGDYAHENSGMRIGHLDGAGKFNNLGLFPERRGLR
jgi:hypothetical protein